MWRCDFYSRFLISRILKFQFREVKIRSDNHHYNHEIICLEAVFWVKFVYLSCVYKPIQFIEWLDKVQLSGPVPS